MSTELALEFSDLLYYILLEFFTHVNVHIQVVKDTQSNTW